MAKRPARTTPTKATDPGAANTETKSAMEQRLMAFAEQLGTFAGTVHGKAEGWMDSEALSKQIASVRDSAADMLKHLAPRKAAPAQKKSAGARGRSNPLATKGRSGGVVDAPGKKHRKPVPPGPEADRAKSQAAKLRAVMPMAKTTKRRGRG
jgi:hypothetical protein